MICCWLFFRIVRIFCLFGLIFALYRGFLTKVSEPVIEKKRDFPSFEALQEKNSVNCSHHIKESKDFLSKENISFSCQALEEDGCDEIYTNYVQKADLCVLVHVDLVA